MLTSKMTGNQVVALCVPITEDNEVIGTMVAAIPFDSIRSHVSDIKVFENGYGYMVEENGLVVAHPDESVVMATKLEDLGVPQLNSIVSNIKRQPQGASFKT